MKGKKVIVLKIGLLMELDSSKPKKLFMVLAVLTTHSCRAANKQGLLTAVHA